MGYCIRCTAAALPSPARPSLTCVPGRRLSLSRTFYSYIVQIRLRSGEGMDRCCDAFWYLACKCLDACVASHSAAEIYAYNMYDLRPPSTVPSPTERRHSSSSLCMTICQTSLPRRAYPFATLIVTLTALSLVRCFRRPPGRRSTSSTCAFRECCSSKHAFGIGTAHERPACACNAIDLPSTA